MDNIAGTKSSLVWVTHITVLLLVILWLIPTVGLLVSSFRERDAISESGWWRAPFPVAQTYDVSPEIDGNVTQDGELYTLTGSVFGEGGSGTVEAFGALRTDPTGAVAGEETFTRYELIVDDGDGETDEERFDIIHPTGEAPELPEADEDGRPVIDALIDRQLTINRDGSFTYVNRGEISRPPSLYFSAETPPEFTTENYDTIINSAGMGTAFMNTLTVVIPATVIPILIAAFAAYALAWMDFRGRGFLIAMVVGLLVVPLQLALVPMLRFHQAIGVGQSYYGIWFAHTGFGLPLAVYLLRNYMVGLPRDIIESAKVDGATDFQVFTKIVLPLSFPALASFAIFQFLWTWNDLLVAKVFLPSENDTTVMTVKIADDLLGSRGGDWGILAAAAFVSIAVPLFVFFAMQKYLVRGLLAGSVK